MSKTELETLRDDVIAITPEVLQEAAKTIRAQAARIAELEAELEDYRQSYRRITAAAFGGENEGSEQ